jgi:YD repeat-containing protein
VYPTRIILRGALVLAACVAMVATTLAPVYAEVLGGIEASTLGREPLVTPTDDSSAAPDDLQYADPTSGLAGIDPPDPSNGGAAQLDYPFVLPQGRALTPALALQYDSGGSSGWVGQGWSFGVGEVSVDTDFGVPKFCPRDEPPACGNYESESYRLDGDLLSPNAITATPQPRVDDRQDFTRQVEDQYEQIIRRGTNPKDYSWEVHDKAGNVRWYGMFPDAGGPLGVAGTRTGDDRNDLTRDPASILTDDSGNGVTWYLKAQRDIGYNMVRYMYDTVIYQAEEVDHGTRWTKVDTCTGVCAKHVYLKSIFYTGAAEDSGESEDPAYEVRMIRGQNRSDQVLDASAGVLDLDKELLTKIQVRYAKTDKLISEYRLSYETNRYGKTLLSSVRQVGCSKGTCDDADPDSDGPGATHTFDYYDDVADPDHGNGDGFEGAVTWDTKGDDLGSATGALEGKASALGMSSTIGGDGHVYVGFNPTEPTKLGSFGGSVTLDGAQTNSISEFMDLNGDNLPDKVFKGAGGIEARLNTSDARKPLKQSVDFGDKFGVAGLSSLPGEHEFGVEGGVDLNFGVSFSAHVGGSWNWSDGYFNDVNGDGLPDYVNSGTVLYNHLDCDHDPCRPTFSGSDASTRLPLHVQDAGATYDSTLTGTLAMLRRLSPPIDTVRRWVAPYAGTVTVDSDAVLVAPESGSTRLAIQKDGLELADTTLTTAGQSWSQTLTDVPVLKGTRIYFRFSPDATAQDSSVDWEPVVRYTGYTSGPDSAPTDENGLSQKSYDSGADFTLAGRPGGFVGMPSAGRVRFTGRLQKSKVTSDDIRPTVTHRFGDTTKGVEDVPVTVTPLTPAGDPDEQRQKSVVEDGGQWCVVNGAGKGFGCYQTQAEATAELQVITTGETGLFEVTSDGFHVDAITTGDDARQDTVETRLAVDSPIDATVLHWQTKPDLCYLDGASCGEGKPDVVPSVDTDIYPVTSAIAPRQPWVAPAGSSIARIELTGASNRAGDLVFTAKKRGPDGVARVVAKKQIHLAAASLPAHPMFYTPVPLDQGTDYWFDVSTRDPGLSEVVHGVDVRLGTGGAGADWTEGVDVPEQFDATGRQGYFAVAYRGWATAGYRGDGARRTNAIDEDKFRLSDKDGNAYGDGDDACKDALDGPCVDSKDDADFPGDYTGDVPAFDESAIDKQIKEAYAFLPSRTTPDGGDAQGPVNEAWSGPRDGIEVTPDGVGAGLLGDAIPDVDTSTGEITAPILTGSSGPVFALTGGIGPVTGSFGFGWSHSDVDYLDMNGDGFPDLVTAGQTTFTDPRGGMACKQVDGTFDACRGDGPDAVNFDTTFALSGGFNGSPVNIKVNSRAVPNSTKGGSAAKGGGSSKDEYGASVGAGAEISASFSSPNAASPSWNDDGWDVDLGKIPGDPLGKTGIPLQQSVADINGDGLPDKIKVMATGVFVRLNLGYKFADDYVLWADGGFESSASLSGSLSLGLGFAGYNKDFSGGVSRTSSVDFPLYSWADVNGDGVLDALYKTPSGKVLVAFGTGTGVRDGDEYGDTEEMSFQVLGDDDLLDLQAGDTIRQDSSIGYGGGADFTMGFGPLCAPAPLCYLIVNPGAHAEGSASISDVDLQDVNGDGYADSVGRNPGAGDSELDVRLNTHGRTGLLKSVHNPLGGRIDLDYSREGNTIHHPDSAWVLSKVTVDDGRPGDGPDVATSTIDYTGANYDFVHRADLGFRTVTVREMAADGSTVLRTTRRTYSNDSVFDAGLLTDTSLYDGDPVDANLVQQAVSTWRVLDGETGDPLDLSSMTTDEQLAAWATPQQARTEERWFSKGDSEAKVVARTDYTFDQLGNPVTVADLGDPTTASDDVVTKLTYSTCADSAGEYTIDGCGQGNAKDHAVYWNDQLCPSWVSIPASIETRDGDGDLLRYREGAPSLCDNASVTDLHELISGTPGASDATWARTRLAYDAWGSYDRIVYPKGQDGLSYAVQYVRDEQRHTDVAEVTDFELSDAEATDFLADQEQPIEPSHVGLTSVATFDPLSGQVETRTDANGDETTYQHDALGRVSKVTMPDGGWVSYDYHPNAPDYAWAAAHHSDAFHPGDTIDTATFVDGIGRTTQQKREADLFQGAGDPPADRFVVAGAVEYDVLGREVKQWYPIDGALSDEGTYDSRTSTTTPTVRSYDVRDRVLTEKAPNEALTTTAYGFATVAGLHVESTSVTDPLGRTTRTLLDPRGYTHAVDDIAVGKPAVRTSYDVDPLGQLLSVASAGRTQTQNAFDLLGRRTKTHTQDGGTLEYGYDAVGNQVSSQSSVQRADHDSKTRFSYDFGNLTGIDYPDSTPDVALTWGGYGGRETGQHGAGRLIEVTDAARHQVLGYDANGFPASERDTMRDDHWKLGELKTTFDYDWLGRLGTVGLYDGETMSYRYDHGGSLDEVSGAKQCTDVGTLAAPVDATSTTITVNENPLETPPLPFTIRIGGEQLRVTDRVATGVPGQFLYTVQRAVNGTSDAPTAAAHGAGASVAADDPVVCDYRYLDTRQYDQFGQVALEQVGNGDRTRYTRDDETRRLTRLRTVVPQSDDREIQDLNYSYDLVGNVLTYRNELPADVSSLMGGPSDQTYTYDPYYRITHAQGSWHQAPDVRRQYTYDLSYDDATGNVTSKQQKDWQVKDSCTSKCKEFVYSDSTFNLGTFSYSADRQHQAVKIGAGKAAETLSHDLDGNVTAILNPAYLREMSWDANGKMTMVVDRPNGKGGKPTYYTYDWQG